MRDDYLPLFQELQAELTAAGFGYSVAEETELTAVLLLRAGWVLVLEGDRYCESAFSIFVAPTIESARKGQRFAVFLLMRAFESKSKKRYGKPTIKNQVNFLAEERLDIFSDARNYELDYDRLNEK